MNKLIKKLLLVLVTITLINSFSFIVVNGAVLKKNIQVYNSPNPVIDGVLDTSEWSIGVPYTTTLYVYGDTADTRVLDIMFLYNDLSEKLYMGATVEDTNSTNDYLLLIFRTNASSTMILGTTPGNMGFGNGNDMKIGFVNNNETWDAYSLYGGAEVVKDIDDGGTEDFEGKVHDYSTFVTFEWAIPFNSTDVNGRDLAIKTTMTINFFVLYRDVDSGKIYSQIRTADVDYDYCQITLSTETPSVGFFSVWAIIGTSGLVLIIAISRKVIKK